MCLVATYKLMQVTCLFYVTISSAGKMPHPEIMPLTNYGVDHY